MSSIPEELGSEQTLPIDPQRSSSSSLPVSERYILTRIGKQKLAFAARWVGEILVFERSQVLSLPFYAASVFGVIHHRGRFVPLTVLPYAPLEGATQTGRTAWRGQLNAICLGQQAGERAAIGIIVERVLGNVALEEIDAPASLIRQFQPEDIALESFQPQRWHPGASTKV